MNKKWILGLVLSLIYGNIRHAKHNIYLKFVFDNTLRLVAGSHKRSRSLSEYCKMNLKLYEKREKQWNF